MGAARREGWALRAKRDGRCAPRGILALRASKRLRALVEQGLNPGFPRPNKKRAPEGALSLFGWGRGIRTPVGGVRVRSPTTRRSPNKGSYKRS
jgi:hypothetical protein